MRSEDEGHTPAPTDRPGVVRRDDLMWTVQDNGSNTDWLGAIAHARDCRIGGYDDWRLPTIDELAGLFVDLNTYDVTSNDYTLAVHIAAPFRLSGFLCWSSTEDGPESAFGFCFYHGERHSCVHAHRYGNRVLCVRRCEA